MSVCRVSTTPRTTSRRVDVPSHGVDWPISPQVLLPRHRFGAQNLCSVKPTTLQISSFWARLLLPVPTKSRRWLRLGCRRGCRRGRRSGSRRPVSASTGTDLFRDVGAGQCLCISTLPNLRGLITRGKRPANRHWVT